MTFGGGPLTFSFAYAYDFVKSFSNTQNSSATSATPLWNGVQATPSYLRSEQPRDDDTLLSRQYDMSCGLSNWRGYIAAGCIGHEFSFAFSKKCIDGIKLCCLFKPGLVVRINPTRRPFSGSANVKTERSYEMPQHCLLPAWSALRSS